MVHGWHLLDVATVEVVDIVIEETFARRLVRGVVGTWSSRNVAGGIVGGRVSRSLVVHEIVMVRLGEVR